MIVSIIVSVSIRVEVIVIVIITVIVVVCEVVGKEGSFHVIIGVVRQTKQTSIEQPEREKEKVREMKRRIDYGLRR